MNRRRKNIEDEAGGGNAARFKLFLVKQQILFDISMIKLVFEVLINIFHSLPNP